MRPCSVLCVPRIARRIVGVASLGALALVPAIEAWSAEAAREKAVELPAVKVQADVPLVKVGEFSMIEARFGPAAVVHGDYIYIIGGLKADGEGSNTIERFDVRSRRSEVFARLLQPRFWHGAVVSGGKIHILGGATIGGSIRPNLTSRGLTPGNPGGKMRDVTVWSGGLNAGFTQMLASVEVLDPVTGQVAAGVPLPRALHSFGCVAVSDQIGVVGGSEMNPAAQPPTVTTGRLSIFDPDGARWRPGPPLARPRQAPAVVQGPLIIVPGGYDGGSPVTDVDVFDLRSGKWRRGIPLGRETSAHSLALIDDLLFLFGDYQRPEELLVYDLVKGGSETFTLGYTPARHTATVTHDRTIYIIGGRPHRMDAPLKTIQVFALRKDVAAARKKAAEAGVK